MKHNRFWKRYACVTAICAALLVCGLGVFYDFIRVYEQSQPTYAADACASNMTNRRVRDLLEEAVREMPALLDPEEEAARILAESLPGGRYSCRRILSLGDAANPVYGLYSEDLLLGHVTLTEGGKGRYGFRMWRVESVRLLPENIPAKRKACTVFAPVGGAVTVNGKTLGEEWMTTQEACYPAVTPFETRDGVTGTRYEVNLLTEPEVSCILAGVACEAFPIENGFCFLPPETKTWTCRVVVPEGSLVTVNGVPLTEQYADGERIPYEYSPAEGETDALPCAVSYTVAGLYEIPTVEAQLNGAAVPITWNEAEACFTGAYPEALQYTCVITAPVGSTVTVRGVDAAPWLTEKTESPYALLLEELGVPSVLAQYRIAGLYQPSEDVTVIWEGQSLPIAKSENGNLTTWDAVLPETENEAAATLARIFTETYFHYTSRGSDGLYNNLAQVLGYVKPGTALYQKIQNSVNGFYYVTPATSMEYHKLEVERITELQNGGVICTVAFDIDQYIYHVNRRYSGTVTLYLENNRDNYVVSGMRLENDDAGNSAS